MYARGKLISKRLAWGILLLFHQVIRLVGQFPNLENRFSNLNLNLKYVAIEHEDLYHQRF